MKSRMQITSCNRHHKNNRVDRAAYALKSCASINQLKQIHAHIFRFNLHQNNSLASTLLTLYSSSSFGRYSLFIFSSILSPTLTLFNHAIRVFSKLTAFSAYCTDLYFLMLHRNLKPDNFTYPFLFNACASLEDLKNGEKIHCRVVKSGFSSYLPVSNSLIDMYGKCSDLFKAHQIFDEMCDRDIVSYNAVLSTHARLGKDMDIAKRLFDQMPARNLITWNGMIVGYVNIDDLDLARRTFDAMPDRNIVSWTTMLVGYCKNGLLDSARSLFDIMPERNLVSWTAMITGYAQIGRPRESIFLFHQMEREMIKPDAFTISGVISAASQIGDLELANWVESCVHKRDIERNVKVLTALIDMHSKCGNVDKAHRLFEEISQPDAFAYSALINGLASHGHEHRALEIFCEMQSNGINPDYITFIGVLAACSHAGLVKEGWLYWEKMIRDYNIEPGPDHYACMIDMLGRVGQVKEAYELIRSMSPHVGALGSLLACCRIHNNVEIAECIAKILFELEPENTGNYMLLASIYAICGRWEDAEKVRIIMKERGVHKLPGCTWIEVGNEKNHKLNER